MVALESNKILQKFLAANEPVESSKLYDEYIQYLNACGWSLEDFDQEMSKRVDADWDNSVVKKFDN